MIRGIRLINFKSYQDQYFPFAPLTLLMGENGAGKSSLVQSLLLLHQSTDAIDGSISGLKLNGPLCSIGLGRDLLMQGAEEEVVQLEVDSGSGQLANYIFDYQPESDRLPIRGLAKDAPAHWSTGFSYLSAERAGPRLTSPRSIASASDRQLGLQGDGALAVLERFRAEILDAEDPRRAGQAGSLEELFQSYLAAISPSARMELQPYRDVDSIGSSFTFSMPGELPGLPFRPTNVGFGLSYTLPIIVGCLVAQRGSTLVIENPEAHLHTRAQRAIAELIARTATAGVQVIVETHSREIFYCLRQGSIDNLYPESLGCVNYIFVRKKSGPRRSSCHTLDRLSSDMGSMPESFFQVFGSPTDLVMRR